MMIVLTLAAIGLSGCWDSFDLQDIQYVTALGIDYDSEEDEYIIYAQSIDFSHLSVSQEGMSEVDSGAWVAEARGETILMALENFSSKSNQMLHWGHVNVLVYSMKALEHEPIIEINEGLYRFHQVRTTPWVFGTAESLEEILLLTNMYGDIVHTELFNPDTVYKERAFIEPITLHQLMRNYAEKGRIVVLPRVGINKKELKDNNNKKKDAMSSDGAILLKGDSEPKLFTDLQLAGLRWLNNQTENSPLQIEEDGKTIAALNIIRPKNRIHSEVINGEVFFDVHIDVHASLLDFPPDETLGASRTIKEILQLMEKMIEKQVRDTYLLGLNNEKDVYSLENQFYRSDVRSYNQMKQTFELTEASLRNITVRAVIEHTGEYEFYRDRVPKSEQQ
ncbi:MULTISPECIES: Ger(x)C family spore germination protein [Shouchella]|uniref:Ger(X)C family spore germination protein n=2 Tax=Shouchella TaxID=2893057 RepID=A0ABY7WEB6_9BACI|nr:MULTISPECIES: Ger(x)C family spore germination protein [Shouchella]MED4130420.1 Ger(x)C family spore germination protein [Shouchella miscanthi]WDF05846.1 Ger(x)C family spore germination protein [Shouchella hunanensis]